jgi:hypothetical protein
MARKMPVKVLLSPKLVARILLHLNDEIEDISDAWDDFFEKAIEFYLDNR